MDPGISRWMLEFLLRQPIEDRTMKSVLSVLPHSNDDLVLKKMILLKTMEFEISKGLVSEKMLESIESIVLLDKGQGVGISKSIKDAYCLVAVDCTARFVKENSNEDDKFLDAVKRIWRGRVRRVESAAETVDLVSEELRNWKDEFEEAVWDRTRCETVAMTDTRNEALTAVRVYLAEAWNGMGPTFLEMTAEKMSESMVEVQGMGTDGVNDQVSDRAASLPKVHPDLPAMGDKAETQKGNVLPQRKHVAGRGRPSRGVKITDTEELSIGTSSNEYDCLPTPEVDKVQEALRSSSLELKAVVKDPLPDAIRFAETVISDMERKIMNHESSVENQNRMDVDEPSPAANKSVEPIQAYAGNLGNQCSVSEPVQGNEGNPGNQCSRNENDGPRPSLMERNSTARTFEWDDSIDGSPEGSPSRSKRLCLPSPKKNVVSPLKKYEMKKFTRRREIKKWSLVEENTLRSGVQRYGKGNWKLILNSYRDIFEERTEVDLKDKWRNMTR